MSWAEIKKAVNTNINKALDVLITERFSALEQSFNGSISTLNSKNDEISVKADGVLAVASENVRSKLVFTPYFLPASGAVETNCALIEARATGVHRLSFLGNHGGNQTYTVLLRIRDSKGNIVAEPTLSGAGLGSKINYADVYLLKAEKYFVSVTSNFSTGYSLKEIGLCYDLVRDDHISLIVGL